MTNLITSLTNEQKQKVWKTIKDKTIAVIGYGNQGRSQALNMHDSGLNVIVGNVRDSYAELAEKDGFKVYSIAEAAKKADVLFILIPDEVQPEVFEKDINKNMKENSTVVFASGYNYFYGLVNIPEKTNVLMIAPRMIGFGIRDLFLKGQGFPALIAVGKDYTNDAEDQLLALTDAIGVFKPNGVAIWSSFREETLVDLLTEHSWAGALLYIFRAYYEVATELGASPEAVILELYASGELEEIARSMKEQGLFKQLKNHSRTSQYGQLTRGPKYADEKIKEIIRNEAMDILNGAFAKEWMLEKQAGFIHFNKLYELATEHPMEKEEEKLYKILGRIK